VNYASYLGLDGLLSSQRLATGQDGRAAAHDEMLFIIVHQTYELWFKQVLHEVVLLQRIFGQERIPDRDLGQAVHTLTRIVAILKHLTHQVEILETMTPMDFLEFRDLLRPASGFQSTQFRLIETRLGLPRGARQSYDGRPFDAHLDEAGRAALLAAEAEPALFAGVEAWLARMPFLDSRGFDFGKALLATFVESEERIARQPGVTEAEAAAQRATLDRHRHVLKALLDDEIFSYVQPEQKWRMRRLALEGALFIFLYRDMPLLQQPFRTLSLLMDIDEQLALWRTRHATMVSRMIGDKAGTGGSSGARYLHSTVHAHRVFADLFGISTFLLPKSMLPKLPPEMEQAMSFPSGPAA
jgi:tryptophan 2,3-dioxygenase